MITTDGSERSWFVYVLRNPDGKIYIGQTENGPHRLCQHNDPIHTLTRTTKRFRGPWELVYSEAATSRSAALSQGKALKSGQSRAWSKRHLGC
jgi:predicted GIY-YIG superfamily endonuclease